MTEISSLIESYEASLTHPDPNRVLESELSHQEKKSARMQIAILEATIVCLADLGYHKTTTQLVAKTAKVSRGALLHHFATRSILIEALVDYLMSQRTRTYVNEITKLTKKERIELGTPLEFYWRMGQTKEAFALLELTFVARTDQKLDKIVTSKVKEQRLFMSKIIPKIFPEWSNVSVEDIKMAQDMVNVLITGMTIERNTIGSQTRRIQLRKFVFDTLQVLR